MPIFAGKNCRQIAAPLSLGLGFVVGLFGSFGSLVFFDFFFLEFCNSGSDELVVPAEKLAYVCCVDAVTVEIRDYFAEIIAYFGIGSKGFDVDGFALGVCVPRF